MSGKGMSISLTAYDDLFKSEEERQTETTELIQLLPLGMFYPFPNHPYKIRDDDEMRRTVESVAKIGVLNPIIARPRAEGGYEIVSGHRRLHASKLAGWEKIPAVIRNYTDDEAIIAMVDSNAQREKPLPSEKAFAYKMRLDATKRQAGRPSKENSATRLQNFNGKTSRELLAEGAEESHEQIRRYIRLTYLIQPLLDMVDNKNLTIKAGTEISYFSQEQQNWLLDAMDYAQMAPSVSQAKSMRRLFDAGILTAEKMREILSAEKPLERKITLRNDKLMQYFPSSYTPRQMEDIIVKLLESWSRQQKERDNHAR